MGEDSDRDVFMKRLAAFNESRGVSMTSSPTISKHPLDLFQLYNVVKEKGGFQEVSKTKSWKEIASICNCMVNPSATYAIRKQYIKHLLPFECKFDLGGIDHTTIIAANENKSKKSKETMSPGHSDSNSQGFPLTPGSMEPPSSPYPGNGPSPMSNNYQQSYPHHHPGMPNSHYPPPVQHSHPHPMSSPLPGPSHSPHHGGKKLKGAPSPGTADSDSRGSYPQSGTPVQLEGPYPPHHGPPPNSYGPGPGMYPNQMNMNPETYPGSGHPYPGYPPSIPSGHPGLGGQTQQPPPSQQVGSGRQKSRKKGKSGGRVPSPGSADSNSQGSYPQSGTPVQLEGPYPPHHGPPPNSYGPGPGMYPNQMNMNPETYPGSGHPYPGYPPSIPSGHPGLGGQTQQPPPPQQAGSGRQKSRKKSKSGGRVPSPGSADSNSQGSYPQSGTPVQFEGPSPSHRHPSQNYPENQGYPNANDYGPSHHPGQPPSNYGHMSAPLPPGVQQSLNRKTGSPYPPDPRAGSMLGPGFPGSQHYHSPGQVNSQYPPYPHHQSPVMHAHQQHSQNSQHPPHSQHSQHSQHYMTSPRPNTQSTQPSADSATSSRPGESLSAQDPFSDEMKTAGHRRHPYGYHQQQQSLQPPGSSPVPGGYYGQQQQQQQQHHHHHHQQQQQHQQQVKSAQSESELSIRNNQPNSRPNSTGMASPATPTRGPESENKRDNYSNNSINNNSDNSNSSDISSRGMLSSSAPGSKLPNQESYYSNTPSNFPPNRPSSRGGGYYGPPDPTRPEMNNYQQVSVNREMQNQPPTSLPSSSSSSSPVSSESLSNQSHAQSNIGAGQRFPHPPTSQPPPAAPLLNTPRGDLPPDPHGNQPNYPGMNDTYRNNGPSNVQISTHNSPLAQRLLAAKHSQSNQPQGSMYPNKLPHNGPAPRFMIDSRENNIYGQNSQANAGHGLGPNHAPPHPQSHPAYPKRHPDFMKSTDQQSLQQPSSHQKIPSMFPDVPSNQYGPYPRPMTPNYPHQPWNRGHPGAPPAPQQPPHMNTPPYGQPGWENSQQRPDQESGGAVPPPGAPASGPGTVATGGWPMNRYPPPQPPPGAVNQAPPQTSAPQQAPPPGINHPGYPPPSAYPYPPDHPVNKMNAMQNRMYQSTQMPGGPPMPIPKAPSAHLTRLLCSSPSLPGSPTPSPITGSPNSGSPLPVSHSNQSQHPQFHPHPHQQIPHGPMPFGQMMMKRDLVFPPGSVEATQPNLSKRRKLTCKDLAPVEAWKLLMSLKSGLLAESTWALDTLAILISDDSSYLYFGLQHLPGLLETLLEHYKKCLNDMFDGLFKDTEVIGHIETPLPKDSKKTRKWYQIRSDDEESGEESGDESNDKIPNKDNDEDSEDSDNKGHSLHGNDNYFNGDKLRKTVSGKKEFMKLDLAINVNIPKIDQKTKMLKSSLDLTFKSRNGKPVRMENADAHLFVTDYEKKWDTLKKGFRVGKEHWSKGHGETTDNILTHFEPEEKSLKLVKILRSKKSKGSKRKRTSSHKSTEKVNVTSDELLANGVSNGNLNKDDLSEFEDESENEDDYPLNSIQDYYDSISQRCLCLSTLIRNLSFVPGNDIEMSKNSGLLLVLGRLLTLKHTHAHRKRKFDNCKQTKSSSRIVSDNEDSSKNNSTSLEQVDIDCSVESRSSTLTMQEDDIIKSNSWWSESIHLLRENTLVTLANISTQLDLDPYPEEISLKILDGLLHWAVCPSSYAQDHLPTTSLHSFTPKRLALESLMKLSIIDSNVDLLLATPPWSRLEKMLSMLAKMLNRNEDQTLREFALVLLTNFAAADSSIARAIALTVYVIPQLISFIEQAEQSALQVANTQGINALRDNPELMGTTLDMVRRAAICLRHFAKIPENRPLLLVHQQRLLSLVFSQILDQGVASVIADVIYELSLYDDSSLPHPHLIKSLKGSSSSSSPSSPSSSPSSTTTTSTTSLATTLTVHKENGDSSSPNANNKKDEQTSQGSCSSNSSQSSSPLPGCDTETKLEKADKKDSSSNQKCNGNLLVTITFLC